MEVKPEVVVLSVKDVDGAVLKKVLGEGQDDAKHYGFRFLEGVGVKFPIDLVKEINAENIVLVLWDPSPKKKNTLECFKQILFQLKGKPNFILLCQTGDQVVSEADKGLLHKWLKAATIPEARFFIVDAGISNEAMQAVLLHKILERCDVLSHAPEQEQLDEVPLNPPPSKAYFEGYHHQGVGPNHSRQSRADFVKANYTLDAQGKFSLENLMQLYAIYMSLPLSSDLSKMIEKGLAEALMSPEENTKYLSSVDSGRSTVLGKNWDRVSTVLRAALEKVFSQAHPDVEFNRIVDVLIKLQNYISGQETAWGYKILGGAEQVKIVETTIEKVMQLMKRIYPCLFRSEITAADRACLNCEYQFPTEVINIINEALPKVGNVLGV